ncbi:MULTISPECIES: hypothetical protein [Thermomonosporaceae]|uniref:hypothetical protein n=1 Tax=Thermomonosporaceae TaxID=2012 RepID=UPI00255A9401|nr:MULTISPECIES: hypothetical protein [Thermomonosporaceae]MDL4771440.1 hypothetical protein [Actinomadura xylanilytica]
MVSALSVTLVACGSKSTTAYCVDRDAPAVGKTAGGHKTVPDSFCNTSDIDRGTVSYGRYYWYYGGKRSSNGYVSGGSAYGPSKGKVKSSSGRTLSRGGFGGGGKSGS